MTRYLDPDVRLGVIDGRPALWRASLPSVRHPISVAEGICLAFLGAAGVSAGTERSIRRTLGCSRERCAPFLRGVIDRFRPFLRGEEPVPWPVGPVAEALASAGEAAGARATRPPAPRAITWLVTFACERRCAYCYFAAERDLAASWAPLPRARALELPAQMGQAGATDLFLTGGEPLLRPDLPEVMAAARDAAVRTHLVTKHPVDDRLARTLRRSGLTTFTFSLDDHRPDVAGRIVGDRAFHGQATRAIRAAADAGLHVEVAAVVLAPDLERLHRLADLVGTLGARRLSLSEPRGLDCAPSGMGALAERVAARMRTRLRVDAGTGGEEADRAGRRVCEVGWSSLDLLPDGTVPRCRYRPRDRALHVASFRDHDLLDLWHHPRLAGLTAPRRDGFAGTACAACSDFASCSGRGWCVASMPTRPGLGPDAFCGRRA